MPSSKQVAEQEDLAHSGDEAGKQSLSLVLKKKTDNSNEFFVVKDAGIRSSPRNPNPHKRHGRSLQDKPEKIDYNEDRIGIVITDAVSHRKSRRKQQLVKRTLYGEEVHWESGSSSDSDIFPKSKNSSSLNKSLSLSNANQNKTSSPSKRRHIHGVDTIQNLLEDNATLSDDSAIIPELKMEFFSPRASPYSSPSYMPSPRVTEPCKFFVDIIPEMEILPNETEGNSQLSNHRSLRGKPINEELLRTNYSDEEVVSEGCTSDIESKPASPSVWWRSVDQQQNQTLTTNPSDRELIVRLVKCDSVSPEKVVDNDVAVTPTCRPSSNRSMVVEDDEVMLTLSGRQALKRRSVRATSSVATALVRSRQTTPERPRTSLHRTALENSPRTSSSHKKRQELVPRSSRNTRTGTRSETRSDAASTRKSSTVKSVVDAETKSTTPIKYKDSLIQLSPKSHRETPGQDKPGPGKPGQGTPGQDIPGQDKPGPGTPGSGKPRRGTPGQARPGLKSGTCTPSMPQRSGTVNTPSTPMEEARAKLHVSAVPKELLCRELMSEKVRQFLSARLEDCSGGAMYISGVPGTGKTATVRKVVEALHSSFEFQYIEVNGMCMTTPYQAYTQILEALTNCRLPCAQALTKLEKYFTRKNNKAVVIVVDELDLICNTRQDVVYNLLDWPRRAPVVVITIANTMDLPERLLQGKVASRLGLARVVFKPYTSSELELIVASRLLGINAFDKDAVRFVAKKVASISGDCRRALDICRRATEVAEACAGGVVNMEHVQTAIDETMLSFKVKAIKSLSRLEQVFLRSVANSVDAGTEETTFFKVYRDLLPLCSLEGLHSPTVSSAQSVCGRLSQVRLIISGRVGVRSKILLNCDPDDIHYALAVK